MKPRSRSGSSKVAMMKAPGKKYLKPRFIFISGGQHLGVKKNRDMVQVLDYLMDVKSGILADAITDERRLEFFRNNAKKTKAAKEGWEKLRFFWNFCFHLWMQEKERRKRWVLS